MSKLKLDEPLSNFAVKFNLHLYSEEYKIPSFWIDTPERLTEVGRCRLTL